MKRFLKITSCLILAVFFATALSGCGKKTTTNSNNIIVWGFEDEDAWKPVASNFAKTYKGYNLIYEKQTLDENYENRVLNSITSGYGPDVWAMPNDWVFRHKEKLYPMPEASVKKVNVEKSFIPAVEESVYINNKIYALAPSVEPLMVYYNPKLFQSAGRAYSEAHRGDTEDIKRATSLLSGVPKTWTDFVSAANIITESGIAGVALGTSKIPNSEDILYLLMLQNETDILSSDYSSASFNLPKDTSTGAKDTPGVRALEFYTSFADQSSANYSWDDEIGDPIDAFATGKTAMIFGYSNLANTLLQKYPNFQYKKGYVPQLTDDADKIVDYGQFTAYGVSRLSKNPTIAWGVVNTLVSDSVASSFNSANYTHTSKTSNVEVSINSRTGNSPEKVSLATAKSLIKGRYPTDFDSIMRNAISSVNNGESSGQTALDLAADKIKQLLQKEDW